MSHPYQPAALVASYQLQMQNQAETEAERRDLAKYPYRSNKIASQAVDPVDLRVRLDRS